MDNKVIVVMGATHSEGLMEEYKAQLAAAGVDTYCAVIDPMPGGPNDMTIRRKVKFVRDMAYLFRDYGAIYITDGWDVLFFGTKQDLIDKAQPLVISAEQNAYPEPDPVGRITGPTPWRYACAGCMGGIPPALIKWANKIERMGDSLDLLDQAWMNRHLETWLVPLDHETQLFYTVSATLETGSLQMKDGRPWNSYCNSFPNFLHFSGGCPTDEVRSMLA